MFLEACRAWVEDLVLVGLLEVSQAWKNLSPSVARVVLDWVVPSLSVENVVGVHAGRSSDQARCVLHHFVVDQSYVTNRWIICLRRESKNLRKESGEFADLRVGSLESPNESVEVVEWSNRAKIETKSLMNTWS